MIIAILATTAVLDVQARVCTLKYEREGRAYAVSAGCAGNGELATEPEAGVNTLLAAVAGVSRPIHDADRVFEAGIDLQTGTVYAPFVR